MSLEDLSRARREMIDSGQISEALNRELTLVVRFLVRNGRLPASYSPYGQWDAEAEAEILQGWLAEKLLRNGGLLALLDRADSPSGFRVMAERSLRQFVLNQRQRSQSQNLYSRMSELLREQQRFTVAIEANRTQDVTWALDGEVPRAPFAGGDRELHEFALTLGEFELLRYKASAEKNSPLLSSEELTRFTAGMLEVAGPMTLTQLTKALELRFDLHAVVFDSLQGEQPPIVADRTRVDTGVVLRDTALAVISELSYRQGKVLLGRRAEVSIEALAVELGCSAGTIANEEQRIAALISRHSENDPEARALLKIIGDLLYEHSGDE